MVLNFIVRKIVKSSIGNIIRLHAHGSGRTVVDNVGVYYVEKDKIRKHSFLVNLVFSWRPIYHDGHDGSYKKVSVVVMAFTVES